MRAIPAPNGTHRVPPPPPGLKALLAMPILGATGDYLYGTSVQCSMGTLRRAEKLLNLPPTRSTLPEEATVSVTARRAVNGSQFFVWQPV